MTTIGGKSLVGDRPWMSVLTVIRIRLTGGIASSGSTGCLLHSPEQSVHYADSSSLPASDNG